MIMSITMVSLSKKIENVILHIDTNLQDSVFVFYQTQKDIENSLIQYFFKIVNRCEAGSIKIISKRSPTTELLSSYFYPYKWQKLLFEGSNSLLADRHT